MDENGEKNYSKRELDHFQNELFNRMDKQDNYLTEIKFQTTKTNGRVNKLEWWKLAFVWALGAMWTLALIMIPLMYKMFIRDLDHRIQNAVIEAVDSKTDRN